MHNPETNPMIKLARSRRARGLPAPSGQKIRIGRRNARAGETEEFLAALVRANRAIDEAARGRLDVVLRLGAAEGSRRLGRRGGIRARRQFRRQGPEGCFRRSTRSRAQDRNTAIACRQGLGTLIAKLGEQVPLALSTPANRIVWSNRDVSVETPAGKIAARAAIVTVSSNVLTSGSIKFTPDIPKRTLDAAAKLSLGSYDRIALQLPGNPLGLARDDIVIEQSNSTRTALLFANIGGSSLCSIDVAGSFGRDLSAQGEKAMVAFAVEWLAKLFGSEVAAAVKKSSATRWNAAPFVLGAMSAAAPGGQASRKVLTEPIGCMYPRRRSHARNAVGHRRRRLGKRRARGGSGVAADRRAERPEPAARPPKPRRRGHRSNGWSQCRRAGKRERVPTMRACCSTWWARCALPTLQIRVAQHAIQRRQADDHRHRDQRVADRAEQRFAGAAEQRGAEPDADAVDRTDHQRRI